MDGEYVNWLDIRKHPMLMGGLDQVKANRFKFRTKLIQTKVWKNDSSKLSLIDDASLEIS